MTDVIKYVYIRKMPKAEDILVKIKNNIPVYITDYYTAILFSCKLIHILIIKRYSNVRATHLVFLWPQVLYLSKAVGFT